MTFNRWVPPTLCTDPKDTEGLSIRESNGEIFGGEKWDVEPLFSRICIS